MSEKPATVPPEALLAETGFVRALARRLLDDESRADDVQQQTWLAAMENPPRRAASIRPWLRSVVRRLVARTWRDEMSRTRMERAAASPAPVPTGDQILAREELRRRVIRAVLSLEEPYRTTVILRFLEERTPRAMAQRLGIPLETVRTRIKRALGQLRARLDREHGGRRDAWALALVPLARLPGGGSLGAIGKGIVVSTKAKVAAGVVLLALLGGAIVLFGSQEPPGESPARADASTVGEEPAAPDHEPQETPDPATPVEAIVRGQVVDEARRPVAGALVAILGETDPFGGEPDATVGALVGRRLRTDEDGRFEALLPGPRRIRVVALRTAAFEPDPDPGGWHDTPVDDLRITGRRMPTARIVVRVVDLGTGRSIEGFACSIDGLTSPDPTVPEGCLRTDGETIVHEVRLSLEARSGRVTVRLIEPRHEDPPQRTLRLREGDRIDVDLALRTGEEIRGTVQDADGRPVEGAVVYFGNQIRARGDEPFRPFDLRRVPDAVRSEATGRYVISGDGDEITVWHPKLTSVTVPIAAAARVTLPPRGTIRGRLVDAGGQPLAGETVVLERRRATTDEGGRFLFEEVEAGVRGLVLPGKRFAGVRLNPGETVEPEYGRGLETVKIDLVSGGSPHPLEGKRRECLLIGLDRVFTMHFARLAPGATSFEAEGVPPGRYLLLTTPGSVACFRIDGPRATVDLGTAHLRVTGPPQTPILVLPADAVDPLVKLLAGRVGVTGLSAEGDVSVGPLPEGRYLVGVDETTMRDRKGLRDVIVRLPEAGGEASLSR